MQMLKVFLCCDVAMRRHEGMHSPKLAAIGGSGSDDRSAVIVRKSIAMVLTIPLCTAI